MSAVDFNGDAPLGASSSGAAVASSRGRLNRLAVAMALVVATLVLVAAAAEGQCEAGSGPHCVVTEATVDQTGAGLSHEQLGGEFAGSAADSASGPAVKRREIDGAGIVGLCVVLALLVFVVLWIGATIKFACDGSLAARLALWGLLPEAYAAISVKSVIALLRLKKDVTPVIVLRNCVTDSGARELAEAIRLYGKRADLQALELPHNLGLGESGVRALVEAALLEGSSLQELDFSYNPQLGGVLVDVLKPLLRPKASKVNILRLADCGLLPSDVQRLAQSAATSGLRTLDLSWNELGGGGEALAAVLEAPVLEELILTCCHLRHDDVEAVADMLPYTSLRSLQLGGNRIGPSGLRLVAAQLPSSHIDELGMEGSDLEAADLGPLGAA